jgi:hypothetical protein
MACAWNVCLNKALKLVWFKNKTYMTYMYTAQCYILFCCMYLSLYWVFQRRTRNQWVGAPFGSPSCWRDVHFVYLCSLHIFTLVTHWYGSKCGSKKMGWDSPSGHKFQSFQSIPTSKSFMSIYQFTNLSTDMAQEAPSARLAPKCWGLAAHLLLHS